MRKDKDDKWLEERVLYRWLAVAGLIIVIFFHFVPWEIRKSANDELKTIANLVLNRNPMEIRLRKSEKIVLSVAQYQFPFHIPKANYDYTALRNILNYLKKGDTVTIKLTSAEYSNLRYNDENRSVEIRAIETNDYKYLDVDIRDENSKRDWQIGFPVGVYMFAIGCLFSNVKTRPIVAPGWILLVGILIITIYFK